MLNEIITLLINPTVFTNSSSDGIILIHVSDATHEEIIFLWLYSLNYSDNFIIVYSLLFSFL